MAGHRKATRCRRGPGRVYIRADEPEGGVAETPRSPRSRGGYGNLRHARRGGGSWHAGPTRQRLTVCARDYQRLRSGPAREESSAWLRWNTDATWEADEAGPPGHDQGRHSGANGPRGGVKVVGNGPEVRTRPKAPSEVFLFYSLSDFIFYFFLFLFSIPNSNVQAKFNFMFWISNCQYQI
jgi:hypothetical protein